MTEPTATGLVHNLETDPNCLRERFSWRTSTSRCSDGRYRYGLKSGETDFTIQFSTDQVTAGGIVVADYLATNGAKASVQYPNMYTILEDNGRLLVIKALVKDACAPLYTQGEIVLRHVTVLSNEDEYRRMRDGYKLPAGFDGDTMPLMGGAGLNAIVWLLASAALTGWWPHELHHQPVHRPLMPQAVKHVGQQRRRECRAPRRRALPLHACRQRHLVVSQLSGVAGTDEMGPCRGRRLHGHQRAERGNRERHAARLGHDPIGCHVEGGEDRRGQQPQHLLPWRGQFDVGGLGRVRGRRMADRPTTPPPVPVVRRRLDAPAVIGGERR